MRRYFRLIIAGLALVLWLTGCPDDNNNRRNANTPPVAVDDAANTDEDTAVNIAVLANDSDADGDALQVNQVTQPANGMVVNNSPRIRYTPAADFNGVDTFTYTIRDGNGGMATATVTVTVVAVNDAPAAVDDMAQTAQGQRLTLDVLANDTDIDDAIDVTTVVLVMLPDSGTATVAANGTITYTPDGALVGEDTLTYTVNDASGALSNEATVTITVNAAVLNAFHMFLINEVLSQDGNDAPVELNGRDFNNRFDSGEPLPIEVFL